MKYQDKVAQVQVLESALEEQPQGWLVTLACIGFFPLIYVLGNALVAFLSGSAA